VIQQRVLESGARVLFDTVDTTDTVCIGFWFLLGSRDEAPGGVEYSSSSPRIAGERGFAHFLEHMLFKGTERRTAFQIAKDLDRVGGFLNAFTERESTCFYAVLPQEHLPLAVDVLADMVFHSLLDAGEIEKEKSVVVNEILSYQDSPEEQAHEAYLFGLWGDHPLARKITGEVADVQGIGRDALWSFYRSNFTSDRLVVSVAGRFDVERTYDQLSQAIDGRRADAEPPLREAPSKTFTWAHRKDRFKQVQIYTGTTVPMVPGEHGPLYDALTFSNAVGESMSSRLFQKIREEYALCYSISCFRSLYTDTSLWTIYSNSSPDLVAPLLRAVNEELARLKTEPLTGDEVEDAKSHLKGTLILSKEDMEVRMKRLVRQHSLVGRVLEYEQSLRLIDEVTRERVLDVARQILNSENFNLVVYGERRIKGFKDVRFNF